MCQSKYILLNIKLQIRLNLNLWLGYGMRKHAYVITKYSLAVKHKPTGKNDRLL